MDHKNKLLPPLVIAAALSVVAFAGIGVAAITGHLPITQLSPNPFSSFTGGGQRPASAPIANPAPRHQGLTRRAGEQQAAGKPLDFRPGTRVPSRKRHCTECGVVDSIRAKEIEIEHKTKGGAVVARLDAGQRSQDDIRLTGGGTTGMAYSASYGVVGELHTEVNFVVTVRMEDGTTRTIYENQRPPFDIGERVRLVNGSVIPLG